MKRIRYSKYVPDPAGEMSMEDLLGALSDYLLQSGFQDYMFYQMPEGEQTVDELKRAIEQALQMSGDEKVIPGTRYDALRLVAAQDCPFHELAGHWVVHCPLQLGGLCRFTSARGGDRVAQGSDVRGGGGVAGGE